MESSRAVRRFTDSALGRAPAPPGTPVTVGLNVTWRRRTSECRCREINGGEPFCQVSQMRHINWKKPAVACILRMRVSQMRHLTNRTPSVVSITELPTRWS